MNLHKKSDQLLEDLNRIERNSENIQKRTYLSIQACSNVLSIFKKEIISEGFDTVDEEINFFKKIKQIPLVPLIYFSEIHSFEIQFPQADKNCQEKFIKKKLKKLNRFFLYNLDFGQYINSGQTHFDKEYYTRDFMGNHIIMISKFYFQDPEFCTPRDMLLGKFKAYNSLVDYLKLRLSNLKNDLNGEAAQNIKKLPWPFTNTDWVEFIYAFTAVLKKKQIDRSISEISIKLQQVFDHEPQKPYKTYQDIKNRKNSRTLFLDQMATILLSEMDRSEE